LELGGLPLPKPRRDPLAKAEGAVRHDVLTADAHFAAVQLGFRAAP